MLACFISFNYCAHFDNIEWRVLLAGQKVLQWNYDVPAGAFSAQFFLCDAAAHGSNHDYAPGNEI